MCFSYSACASDSVVLAEKPKRELASRCSVVRSYSSGLAWVLGLDSSRTVPLRERTACAMASASACVHRRSARRSASSSFLNFGSNHLPS